MLFHSRITSAAQMHGIGDLPQLALKFIFVYYYEKQLIFFTQSHKSAFQCGLELSNSFQSEKYYTQLECSNSCIDYSTYL